MLPCLVRIAHHHRLVSTTFLGLPRTSGSRMLRYRGVPLGSYRYASRGTCWSRLVNPGHTARFAAVILVDAILAYGRDQVRRLGAQLRYRLIATLPGLSLDWAGAATSNVWSVREVAPVRWRRVSQFCGSAS